MSGSVGFYISGGVVIIQKVIGKSYKVIKHNEDEEKKYSLRSSIWKLFNDKWKLVFYQGTITYETNEYRKGEKNGLCR